MILGRSGNQFTSMSQIEIDIKKSFSSLCVKLEDDSIEDISLAIMEEFDMSPYDDNMISEEEFVFDCLNNATLFNLLQNSLKTYMPEHQNSSSEDEDTNNTESMADIAMAKIAVDKKINDNKINNKIVKKVNKKKK